jgi:nucleoside 2-deoxyribosyltransferase
MGGLIGLFLADSVNEDKKKSRRLTLNKRKYMADKKVVFVAFAIEDETQRNFLVGQSLHTDSPFEFTDMSVKEPYDSGWKERVRTRIRRSDGVIVLVSKNSLNSSGQAWEIGCAKEEKKPILAIWAYTDDRTILASVSTVVWAWPTIEKFIDSL